jgi:hypothetical protein
MDMPGMVSGLVLQALRDVGGHRCGATVRIHQFRMLEATTPGVLPFCELACACREPIFTFSPTDLAFA